MKIYTNYQGYNIYVFENAIPKDICEQWILRFPKNKDNFVGYKKDTSEEIYALLLKYVNIPFPVKEQPGYVTFVRLDHPIYEHIDTAYAHETHKVAFYLNEVEHGGTEFIDSDGWLSVDAHQGTVIIFDIRLKHKGQPYKEKQVKYVMGLRLKEDR